MIAVCQSGITLLYFFVRYARQVVLRKGMFDHADGDFEFM